MLLVGLTAFPPAASSLRVMRYVTEGGGKGERLRFFSCLGREEGGAVRVRR